MDGEHSKMAFSNSVITRSHDQRQMKDQAFRNVSRLLESPKTKERIFKEMEEFGLKYTAKENMLNSLEEQALMIIYNNAMCAKQNAKCKKEGLEDIIDHHKSITGIAQSKKTGRFYVCRGNSRQVDKNVSYESRQEVMQVIREEAINNIKMLEHTKPLLKQGRPVKISKKDHEYFYKWNYYFENEKYIEGIKTLPVDDLAKREIHNILYGFVSRYDSAEGRNVDFRKLNNPAYSLKSVKQDIDVIKKIYLRQSRTLKKECLEDLLEQLNNVEQVKRYTK